MWVGVGDRGRGLVVCRDPASGLTRFLASYKVQKAFGPHTIGSTTHMYLLVQVLGVEPSFGDKSTGTHV